MLDRLDPRKQGAETPADIGIFLLGASIGGLADAALNMFGFADPLIIAGLGGSGALGLKKMVWDTRRSAGQPAPQAVEQHSGAQALEELKVEAVLLEADGKTAEARRLRLALEEGEKRGLSPERIRALYART